jgi:dsDNA-specific endonuclease/ATPase MutS2
MGSILTLQYYTEQMHRVDLLRKHPEKTTSPTGFMEALAFTKEKKFKKEEFIMEVDLHIEKLVQNFRGMSNFDILNMQMDTVKHKLEFAIKNRLPKMVLIHGVGEGVLKAELDFLLGRYDNITFQDANYQKYGLGATEVYFIQKKML